MTDLFSTPFVTMFESLGMGARFQRGRRDVRAGHVRHLGINTSLVVAQVRGPEEPVTHRARIAVRAFGAAAWARIEADLAAEARHVADLIAGRLPDDIDEVIARAGLRLLPDSIADVAMDCTCEQWPMPCGHLAAGCYALARSFDTDPFGALAWRGRDRDELLTHLHELRRAAGPATDQPAADQPAADVPSDGLGDPAAFWSASGEPPAPAGSSGIGSSGAGPVPRVWSAGAAHGLGGPDGRTDALLDELDPLLFGGRSITESLRPAYRALAPPTERHRRDEVRSQ